MKQNAMIFNNEYWSNVKVVEAIMWAAMWVAMRVAMWVAMLIRYLGIMFLNNPLHPTIL